jgi:hypothetical protein
MDYVVMGSIIYHWWLWIQSIVTVFFVCQFGAIECGGLVQTLLLALLFLFDVLDCFSGGPMFDGWDMCNLFSAEGHRWHSLQCERSSSEHHTGFAVRVSHDRASQRSRSSSTHSYSGDFFGETGPALVHFELGLGHEGNFATLPQAGSMDRIEVSRHMSGQGTDYQIVENDCWMPYGEFIRPCHALMGLQSRLLPPPAVDLASVHIVRYPTICF